MGKYRHISYHWQTSIWVYCYDSNHWPHECTWVHTNTRVHNSQQAFGIIAVSPTIGHMRTHGQMSSQWTTSIGGLAFSQIIGHMGT